MPRLDDIARRFTELGRQAVDHHARAVGLAVGLNVSRLPSSELSSGLPVRQTSPNRPSSVVWTVTLGVGSTGGFAGKGGGGGGSAGASASSEGLRHAGTRDASQESSR